MPKSKRMVLPTINITGSPSGASDDIEIIERALAEQKKLKDAIRHARKQSIPNRGKLDFVTPIK